MSNVIVHSSDIITESYSGDTPEDCLNAVIARLKQQNKIISLSTYAYYLGSRNEKSEKIYDNNTDITKYAYENYLKYITKKKEESKWCPDYQALLTTIDDNFLDKWVKSINKYSNSYLICGTITYIQSNCTLYQMNFSISKSIYDVDKDGNLTKTDKYELFVEKEII